MSNEQLRHDLAVARLLVAAGWRQGWYHGLQANGMESYCATGAMMAAVGVPHIAMPDYSNARVRAMRAAFAAANELDGGEQLMITVWNDEPGRTREEVLNAFDRALDALTY